MPVYEYECSNNHRFELRQSFFDEPVTSCPTCDSKSRRIIHSVAVHYKGSGFYTTDYARPNSSESGSSKDERKESGKEPAGTATAAAGAAVDKGKMSDAGEE